MKVGIKVSPVSTIWIGTILWDPFSDFCEGLESIRGIMSSGGAEINLNLQELNPKDLYSKDLNSQNLNSKDLKELK